MLWVGGSILVHGMAELGYQGPEHFIEGIVAEVRTVSAYFAEILRWKTTSAFQAALAIVIGGLTIVLLHASAPWLQRLDRRVN